MSKNICNGFFLITSCLEDQHERYVQTVGNLCPESNVISVNRMGINKPGMLSSVWNINKAVFLLSVDSPDVVDSVLDNLKNITDAENIHTIKIDGGINKEKDPIYNSEKHLFVLKSDFDIVKNHLIAEIDDLRNEINRLKIEDTNLRNEINNLRSKLNQIFNNNGILYISNDSILSIENPNSPSVLTSSGSVYSWIEYAECKNGIR